MHNAGGHVHFANNIIGITSQLKELAGTW